MQYSVRVSAGWSLPKALYIFTRYYGLIHVGFVAFTLIRHVNRPLLTPFQCESYKCVFRLPKFLNATASHSECMKTAVGMQVGLSVIVSWQSSDLYPSIINETRRKTQSIFIFWRSIKKVIQMSCPPVFSDRVRSFFSYIWSCWVNLC